MVKKTFKYLYSSIVYLFLYAPILIMVIYSFNGSKFRNKWGGFSLKWYKELFENREIMQALWNTLAIAAVSAIVSTILGLAASWLLYRMRNRKVKSLMLNTTYLPMLNPDIITGISLFLLFVSLGITQGYATVILAHITFCTPYVVLCVLPRLQQMNPNIYEAALDLGATPSQALRKVIIPEIKPGMISGFILAFTLSIDDFAVTIFTIGTEGLETLSTYIYADARKGGLTPELRPLSTIIFVTVLVLLIVINVRSQRAKNKKQA